ncbi:pentatricopeptide repeat-containing protein At5g44230 [Punica granatum]|uniref:DYW domain-containing protein n=2 Tax=Punica granatum TaxID=22663 RepID=A0A218XWC1_PUNGR|nr:pentatricopeptide repeat-containing protein At5g44230 [Punica granatum]OWM88811.1 hypothetical protein CDL15_Pgr020765 [Punica granatum]PKI51068.1 hypothetical protein CRG98_028540 [Punica granatum]
MTAPTVRGWSPLRCRGFHAPPASSLKFIPKQRFRHLPEQRSPAPALWSLPLSDLESYFVSLLNASATLPRLRQLHGLIYRSGLHQSCFVLTKLIRSLTALDVPVESYPKLIFRQAKWRNPFLYTALIRGYSLRGNLADCVDLYGSMRRDGISPVTFTFTAIFKACGENLDLRLGEQMHCQMALFGGFGSDLYVGNTLIDMYVKCGVLGSARKMFDLMPERDLISWTTLIVAYSKSQDMASARRLFDCMPEKDAIAWTAMVTGFVQNSKPGEALKLFDRMQTARVSLDEYTLAGVISACAQLGASKYAKWVSEIAEENMLSPTSNVVVGSALIDMYAKCGQVDDAYKVFEAMKERNVYSYSSMIVGFAINGQPKAAISLFHEMLKSTDIRPNDVTFIGVLTACSHGGMVDQGRQIFASMEKTYGILPNADHYACMVDLLGRAGKLTEALELIRKMPVEPHGGVWGALLGACKVHTDPDIAEIAAAQLFIFEPDAVGNYILLSNIYASSGRWDDVLRVRKLMRGKKLRKNPGCSWFEAKKGEIHEFFAGDTKHPRSDEIKQVLDELVGRLEASGYEPILNSVAYDVSDKDKRRILLGHSEKLALAFGILSSTSGSTIRIVKNLRICEDCHSFMCGASQVTGRDIVIRDNMRFHHFRDGACSCRNFW